MTKSDEDPQNTGNPGEPHALGRLDEWQQRQLELDREIRQELKRVLNQNWKSTAQRSETRTYISKLLAIAEPRHLDIPLVRHYLNNNFSMPSAVSWTRQLVSHSEVGSFANKTVNWKINGKRAAYRFVDALEVRRPALHVADPIRLNTYDPRYPSVLKPTAGAGATGVYLLVSPDRIHYAKTGEQFPSWQAAQEHARSLLTAGKIHRDSWLSEELIIGDRATLAPATDLKFYTFYGEVAFVGEIQRYPRVVWDYWRSPGERIEPPGNWRRARFEGEGPSEEDLEIVQFISKSIPYPFMRIDMLRGEDGLVFGEFTPRPGPSMKIKPEWDRSMGESWFRAEQRLFEDLLLHKKDFKAFLDATSLRV